jgi:hypothetical protein
MPICDQMIIAFTIRSGRTDSKTTPMEPVLPNPIPAPVTASATSQSATLVVLPASVSPALMSPAAASTSSRGLAGCGRGGAGHQQRHAGVGEADLGLIEPAGEVQREYTLDDAEPEDREQDRRARDPEPGHAQCAVVG